MSDGSRPQIELEIFGKTDVGLIREHNEDNFLVADLTKIRVRVRFFRGFGRLHEQLWLAGVRFGMDRDHEHGPVAVPCGLDAEPHPRRKLFVVPGVVPRGDAAGFPVV